MGAADVRDAKLNPVMMAPFLPTCPKNATLANGGGSGGNPMTTPTPTRTLANLNSHFQVSIGDPWAK